jgi:hypothetical protein
MRSLGPTAVSASSISRFLGLGAGAQQRGRRDASEQEERKTPKTQNGWRLATGGPDDRGLHGLGSTHVRCGCAIRAGAQPGVQLRSTSSTSMATVPIPATRFSSSGTALARPSRTSMPRALAGQLRPGMDLQHEIITFSNCVDQCDRRVVQLKPPPHDWSSEGRDRRRRCCNEMGSRITLRCY